MCSERELGLGLELEIYAKLHVYKRFVKQDGLKKYRKRSACPNSSAPTTEYASQCEYYEGVEVLELCDSFS